MQTKPNTSARSTELRRRARAELREFSDKQHARPLMRELYRDAEAQLRKQKKHARSKAGAAKSEADPQRLLHELQVHQVELEMQNVELQKSRDETELLLEKYTDLYDFAPVGYFTLDAGGLIRMVNLTGAHQAGIERSRLIGQRFRLLLAAEHRPGFDAFLQKVFAEQSKQSGGFEFRSRGPVQRVVNLEAQRLLNGQECRVAVMDITARKFAEAVSAQLAAMVNSSSDAIIGLDLNGNVTSWNTGAEKIFGYSAGEMMGGSITQLIPASHRSDEVKIMDRVSRGRSMKHYETIRVVKDGRQIDVSVTVSPVWNAAGKIIGASKVARDITARKESEAELRVSEIRYRRLFEAAHDGVLLLDPVSCKITDANPFMTKLLGYPNDQLVGKELYEIGLLKDETASREMFRKLKRKHEVRYENMPLESQTGRHQDVEVVANLYQENGHSVIQCNIRDITERKQAEEMLRRNEALFSALIEQAPVGVYVVDYRLRLQQVNPKARPVFRNVRRLIGRDFSEVMHIVWPKKIAAEIAARFRHTLETGKPFYSAHFSERRRDTAVTEFYEWQIQRVILPAGERGVVCFFNDVTERKRAEATQRRMDAVTATNLKLNLEIIRRQAVEASLKQSEQHQGRLLDESRRMQAQLRQLSREVLRVQEEERKRISRELHDVIAQTLTGINIRLATLKKEAGRGTGGFDRNLARTQRLIGKSVETVHRFARELRPAVLDDLGLIPALHSFMKDFAARTGLHTRLTAFAEVEQIGIAQRTVLFRVAQEALINVSRHARASRVEVGIKKFTDHLGMTIKDNGKSFDAERALQMKSGGRLGLLGMRERLEMVGGTFSIASAPDKGTTILAQIPLGNAGGGGGGRKTRRQPPLKTNPEFL